MTGWAALDDTVRLLGSWEPTWPDETPVRDRILEHLAAHGDRAGERTCPGGHVTVSVVLAHPPTEQTALTLHPKFGRWMQLGGHLEPGDSSLTAAALREAREESGQQHLADPVLLGVGAFGDIACGGERTWHYDVRFLVTTDTLAVTASAESLDLAWWPLKRLPRPHDDDLARLAAQSAPRLTGSGEGDAGVRREPRPAQ